MPTQTEWQEFIKPYEERLHALRPTSRHGYLSPIRHNWGVVIDLDDMTPEVLRAMADVLAEAKLKWGDRPVPY